MIEFQEVSVKLDNRQILNQISFVLESNENLVILGRSGSGKTVLTKTLLGIYPPSKGRIMVDGLDIGNQERKDNQALKEKFAMVFQNAALLDSFTVYQNISLPLFERRYGTEEEIRSRVDQCLEIVGLAETKSLYPAELSGGMKKRIGIARALAYNPQYIIFDEPVSGLDPMTSAEVLYYIAKIAQDRDVTVITVTHNLKDLHKISDKLLFIDNGKLLYYGNLTDIGKTDNSMMREFLDL